MTFREYKQKLRDMALCKNAGIEDPNWQPEGWDAPETAHPVEPAPEQPPDGLTPEDVATWDRLMGAAFRHAQRDGNSEQAYQSLLHSIQLQMPTLSFEAAKSVADHWREKYDSLFAHQPESLRQPDPWDTEQSDLTLPEGWQ